MKSKTHTIIPLAGTDQLKFGTPRENVKNEFVALFGRSFKRDNNDVDDYGDFHAYFENGTLCAIEFFEPCEVIFDGIQLLGQEFDMCKDFFSNSDENLRIEDSVGFSSVKYQIGVYAPYGTIESVLVAKDGYYQ